MMAVAVVTAEVENFMVLLLRLWMWMIELIIYAYVCCFAVMFAACCAC